jgi:predicted Zn-dependent protease
MYLFDNVTPKEAQARLNKAACEVYDKMMEYPHLYDFSSQRDPFKTRFVQGFISGISLCDSYELCVIHTDLYKRATYQDWDKAKPKDKKVKLTIVK